MERSAKIAQIKDLFSQLFCFTSEEIEQYLSAAEFFPEEGLDRLIESLQEGKKQQDEFLTRRIDEDKKYAADLSQFLKKTTNNLKSSYEQTEHEEAESVLGNL